jgi:hypothetical protein
MAPMKRSNWIAVSFACLMTAAGWAACSSASDGGGPQNQTGIDAPIPVCGDGVCSSSEINTCTPDCGGGGPPQPVCGNHICEPGETAASCPTDCNVIPPDGPPGTDAGPGGPLDCSDPNVIAACLFCVAGVGCSGPGINVTDCTVWRRGLVAVRRRRARRHVRGRRGLDDLPGRLPVVVSVRRHPRRAQVASRAC